jgi:hypothetical protein
MRATFLPPRALGGAMLCQLLISGANGRVVTKAECPDADESSRCETWNIYAALQIVSNRVPPLAGNWPQLASGGRCFSNDKTMLPRGSIRLTGAGSCGAKWQGGKALVPKRMLVGGRLILRVTLPSGNATICDCRIVPAWPQTGSQGEAFSRSIASLGRR